MRIPLQSEQSPASVLTAFLRSEAANVDLVFPSSTSFFDDPANLDLLMVQAKLSGKSFRIITANKGLSERLAAMGIAVEHAALEAQLPMLRRQSAESQTSRGEEKRGKQPRAKETNVKRGRSFEEIQRDLTESGADEFTKRYFDLEAPRPERSALSSKDRQHLAGEEKEKSPSLASFETHSIKSSEYIHGKTNEAPLISAKSQDYPGGEDEKSIRIDEEIASFVKKTDEDGAVSPEKNDLGKQLAFAKYHSRRALISSIGGSFVAILLIIWAVNELPRASLTIFAQREKAAFSVDVLASQKVSDVDLEARAIPLQRIQADKEIQSSFDAKIQGTLDKKASGSVTVINELTHPQAMIPSRFQALTGQIYWSQRNIKVPGAKFTAGKLQPGTLSIDLIADKTGKEFNLDCSQSNPCKFSIPAWKGTENFVKLYAIANSPIKGGAIGRGFIVSEDEYKKAELVLKDNLLQEAQKELTAQVPAGFALLESTITSDTPTINATPGAGELAPEGKFTLRGKLTLRAFLVKTNDVKALIDKITKAQIPQDKITRPESVTFQYSLQRFDFDKNQAFMKVQAQEELQLKLDSQVIIENLLGKSEQEVQKILTDMPHVQSAEVVLWPFWVRAIPTNPDRVTIEIK